MPTQPATAVISIDPNQRLRDAFVSGELALVAVPIRPHLKPEKTAPPPTAAPATKSAAPKQYTTAYFAQRRPRPQDLTAGWRRTNFVYTTQLGVCGWRAPLEEWDFDLLPWVKNGRLRWCARGSGNSMLSPDPPDRFPYAQAAGERRRSVVWADQLLRCGPLPQAA